MLVTKIEIERVIEEVVDSEPAPGIDRMNVTAFLNDKKRIVGRIELAFDKPEDFSFCKYKELLKLKGPNKCPRRISIPCIRDRVILKIILERFLDGLIQRPKFSELIDHICASYSSSLYNRVFRGDITSFFDNINRSQLLDELKLEKSIPDNVHALIETAINTNTYDIHKNKKSDPATNSLPRGIPQGIIISNALAEIYLKRFDEEMRRIKGIAFYRFVDDFIVFFNTKDHSRDEIKKAVKQGLNRMSLTMNASKCSFFPVSNKQHLSFLGYVISNNQIDLEPEKMIKKRRRLQRIINDFIKSNNLRIKGRLNWLQWKLNVEIGGVIYKRRCYGWSIYYKNLTNRSVFIELDRALNAMIKKSGIDRKKLKIRSFLKVHQELARSNVSGMINISKQYPTASEKKVFLENEMGFPPGLSDERAVHFFNEIIKKTIYEVERDIDTNASK